MIRTTEGNFRDSSLPPEVANLPAAALFDGLRCAERRGYLLTAKKLLELYESNAQGWALDEEYTVDQEFITHLSFRDADLDVVQPKLSRIMVARELRDYSTLTNEFETALDDSKFPAVTEMKYNRARWLEMSGNFDEAEHLMTDVLSDTPVSDPRFDEIKERSRKSTNASCAI